MECSICLDIMNPTTTIILNCKHEFHIECLKKLIRHVCPLCKRSITRQMKKYKIQPNEDYYDSNSDNYTTSSENSNEDENLKLITEFSQNYSGEDFIKNINELNISLNEETIKRTCKLFYELQKYDLKISNSEMCKKYIIGLTNNINNVINYEREMHWFCNFTEYYNICNYLKNIINQNYKHKIEIVAKKCIIKDYVLTHIDNNLIEHPPDTPEMNKLIYRELIIKKDIENIKEWNGNLKIKISYLRTNKHLINKYLSQFSDEYVNNNYLFFIQNDFCFIKTNLKKEIKNYSQLENIIRCKLKKKLFEYISIYVKNNIKEYKKNHAFFNNFGYHLKNIIQENILKYIKKTFTYYRIKKFINIKKDEWKAHIYGNDIYKEMVCNHIEFMTGGHGQE